MQIKNLKIRTTQNKKIIQGTFNGTYRNGENCATGTICLIGADLLEKLNISNDSIKKLDSLLKFRDLIKDIKPLKSNDKFNVTWNLNSIVFDVWDGYKEDNEIYGKQ